MQPTTIPVFRFMPAVKNFNLSDQSEPGIPNTRPDSPYLGMYMNGGPSEGIGIESDFPQMLYYDFTDTPGKGSAIYYSLVFQLPKWGFNVAKVDEWIEVSPTRADYYQATVASKEALAGTIKQGLASAASAISDWELAKHDLRKYREILGYFEKVAVAKKLSDSEKRADAIRKAEHSLRAMFVDQVDMHTGEGISLRSIAPRWSTIIADFMRLTDEMDNVKKISDELKVSKAEAVILKTKNDLYKEWKILFGTAAKDRYEVLMSIVESRKKSISEYKDWIRPYLVRFKALKVGAERQDVARKMMKSFADVTGQSTYSNNIVIWAWKPFKTIEPKRAAVERGGKFKDFTLDPYDDLARNHFIFGKNEKGKEIGLAAIFPWLKEKSKKPESLDIVKSGRIKPEEATRADEIAEEIKGRWKKYLDRLDPNELYYNFMEINVDRVGFRLQSGENENIMFTINSRLLSQNILLVKLIEIECRDIELERYIETMMGTRAEAGGDVEKLARETFPGVFEGSIPGEKEGFEKIKEDFEKFKKEVNNFISEISGALKIGGSAPLWLVKPGPYEREWKNRIAKNYLKPLGGDFGNVVNFLKSKGSMEGW